MKQYHIELKSFTFLKRDEFFDKSKNIPCHALDGWCHLWIEIEETVRKEFLPCTVNTETVRSLKQLIEFSSGLFHQKIAIANCTLFSEVGAQLNTLIANANRCDGFWPGDLNPRNTFGNTAMNYINQYFGTGSYNYLREDVLEKITFSDPHNLTAIQTSGEKLLRTMYFSFCSWRFDDNSKLTDPNNCFVTLIFTIYDHATQSFFEARLNVASVQWIEEQSRNQALTFLRYILIVEKFDIDVIMQHVYHTVQRVSEQEDSGHGYAIGDLSFGYELPREKLEIANDDNAPFAM